MAFFDKNFRKEDLFLYLVALGLIGYFAVYFHQSRAELLDNIWYDSGKITEEKYLILVEQSRMRYEFTSKVLLSNSIRSNMSFLVGTVLCVLGTMIVIRRVRGEIEVGAGDADRSLSFKSTSPGVFLAFMGSLIIIFSIAFKDKYEVSDGGFQTQEQVNPDDSHSDERYNRMTGDSTQGNKKKWTIKR